MHTTSPPDFFQATWMPVYELGYGPKASKLVTIAKTQTRN